MADMEKMIAAVSKVLWDNERKISDGYEFYAGYEHTAETIHEIAREIVRAVLELTQ